VLKRFYELRGEIQLLMDQKGKDVPELQENKWLLRPCFSGGYYRTPELVQQDAGAQ